MVTIEFETTALHDSITEMQKVIDRLPILHGDDYRALERDIERLSDQLDSGKFQPVLTDAGGGFIMFSAPEGVSDILRRARELGVI